MNIFCAIKRPNYRDEGGMLYCLLTDYSVDDLKRCVQPYARTALKIRLTLEDWIDVFRSIADEDPETSTYLECNGTYIEFMSDGRFKDHIDVDTEAYYPENLNFTEKELADIQAEVQRKADQNAKEEREWHEKNAKEQRRLQYVNLKKEFGE